MSSMPSFSMSASHHQGGSAVGVPGSMGPSPAACSLQQRDAVTGGSYSCMTRPPTYDPLTLGAYGARPSPCSPTQPYQTMNGHQYSTNGTSSTGIFITLPHRNIHKYTWTSPDGFSFIWTSVVLHTIIIR